MFSLNCTIRTRESGNKPVERSFSVSQKIHEHTMFGKIDDNARVKIPIEISKLDKIIEHTLIYTYPDEELDGKRSIMLFPQFVEE
jgi:hypothetical protein